VEKKGRGRRRRCAVGPRCRRLREKREACCWRLGCGVTLGHAVGRAGGKEGMLGCGGWFPGAPPLFFFIFFYFSFPKHFSKAFSK